MSGFGGFNSNTGGTFGAGGNASTAGKNVFGASGTGGFGASTAGTSGFGATKTNVFGASAGTGGFGTSGAAGFGTTSTAGASAFGATPGGLASTSTSSASGFGASNTAGSGGFGSSSLGGFGAKSTAGTSSFGTASTGNTGFGTSSAGGFGATVTGTSGFGTSSAGGFGATKTGASAFGTSSVGGFGAASTGTSGLGTSSAGGFGATSTSSAFGGTGFGTTAFGVPSSGANSSSAPGIFAGFGATASKPTLGTGFGTSGFGISGTTNTTGLGAQPQAAAFFDASELKPWELYDKMSSISEAEVKTFDLGKRQPDTFSNDSQDVPQPQPEKPTLEAPQTKGKLDCIQTFAMPNVDLISDYMAHGNHLVFTSSLYFSEEVTSANTKNSSVPKAEGEPEEEFDQEFPFSYEHGFLTTPTICQLSALSEDDRQWVENFSISLPGVGRADYDHPVDLSALFPDFQKNLQLIFKLRQGAFCLSPSQFPHSLKDTGLLGPINVTLYHLWLTDPATGSRIYSNAHPAFNALVASLKQLPGISFKSLDIKMGLWKFTYNYPGPI